MSISQELLEVLVCPACKKPLTLSTNQEGLKCAECRRVYPIRDDIAVLLIDQAALEGAS